MRQIHGLPVVALTIAFVTIALTIAFVTIGPLAPGSESPGPRDRQEFAAALAKVDVGMERPRILALLGEPDDVRTHRDPGGISTTRTKEIWCYGTSGHLTFPSLGRVYIDRHDRVQYVYGGDGRPIDPALFREAEVRELLQLVNKAPSWASNYSPLPVIQVVNALQQIGKGGALAIIDEYLRVSSDFHDDARDGLFLVLRVLFDVPEEPGYMPAMNVGMPQPPAPRAPRLFPRFPLVLVDGVPLLLTTGYRLRGAAQAVDEHVSYFREHGTVRRTPLRPTDSPLQTLEKLSRSEEWVAWLKEQDPSAIGRDSRKKHVADQLLHLVDTVYPTKSGPYGSKVSTCCAPGGWQPVWQKAVAEVAARGIRWDTQRNVYTFADGSFNAPLATIYYREIWQPEIATGNVELILERKNETYVEMIVKARWRPNEPRPVGVFELYGINSRSRCLARVELRQGGEFSRLTVVELKPSMQVVATFVQDERTQTSAPLSP